MADLPPEYSRHTGPLRGYRREHGHDPPRAVCHQLARQANLDTRQGRKADRSLAQLRADWRQELTQVFGRRAVTRLMAAVPAAPLPAAGVCRADTGSSCRTDGGQCVAAALDLDGVEPARRSRAAARATGAIPPPSTSASRGSRRAHRGLRAAGLLSPPARHAVR
jgi:hypothetical protein